MVRRAETLANAMRNVEMILVDDKVLATSNAPKSNIAFIGAALRTTKINAERKSCSLFFFAVLCLVFGRSPFSGKRVGHMTNKTYLGISSRYA
jgi:hypothetical protein